MTLSNLSDASDINATVLLKKKKKKRERGKLFDGVPSHVAKQFYVQHQLSAHSDLCMLSSNRLIVKIWQRKTRWKHFVHRTNQSTCIRINMK